MWTPSPRRYLFASTPDVFLFPRKPLRSPEYDEAGNPSFSGSGLRIKRPVAFIVKMQAFFMRLGSKGGLKFKSYRKQRFVC